ncbi:MAG: PaaI family thioesterase [bacterium]
MCQPDWEQLMDPQKELPFRLDTWVDLAPFERTLGMKIETAENGEAVLAMPFTIKLAQGAGLLHGGALTALADTAAAMAIKTLLKEGTHFATVSLEVDFLAPVREGEVKAIARAEPSLDHERVYVSSVDVIAEDGTVAATFESIFKVALEQA